MTLEYQTVSKYIKNTTEKLITSSYGNMFPPGKIVPLTTDDYLLCIKDLKILEAIKKGDISVGSDGETFFGNPVHGLVFFLNQFDDGGMVIWNDNIIKLAPTIRQDPDTGIEGTSLTLAIFQILKDFYNDPANPLYTGEDYQCMYWDNIPKIKETMSYVEHKIKQETYKKPRRLIVQDGTFTKPHLLKHDVIIFNENSTMISEIDTVKPTTQLFGKVDGRLSYTNFVNAFNSFDNSICGVYVTNTGYNKGTVDTNSRSAFNEKLNFVHSSNKVVMIDTEVIDHITGTINDVDFPNTIWNVGLENSSYSINDWYLINDFVIKDDVFVDKTEWLDRMNEIFSLRLNKKIFMAALTSINEVDSQQKFDISCMTSNLCALDVFGVVDGTFFMPSNECLPHVQIWEPFPKIVIEDGFIRRYLEGATVSLDFSTGYNHTIIEL